MLLQSSRLRASKCQTAQSRWCSTSTMSMRTSPKTHRKTKRRTKPRTRATRLLTAKVAKVARRRKTRARAKARTRTRIKTSPKAKVSLLVSPPRRKRASERVGTRLTGRAKVVGREVVAKATRLMRGKAMTVRGKAMAARGKAMAVRAKAMVVRAKAMAERVAKARTEGMFRRRDGMQQVKEDGIEEAKGSLNGTQAIASGTTHRISGGMNPILVGTKGMESATTKAKASRVRAKTREMGKGKGARAKARGKAEVEAIKGMLERVIQMRATTSMCPAEDTTTSTIIIREPFISRLAHQAPLDFWRQLTN
mmetsp:Transcript_36705/g.84466  ORF Transcript_36705/g.84466 Transcript_36705/m.84466 type:complete len:309 (+) Transcript_36705:821-1747(+)